MNISARLVGRADIQSLLAAADYLFLMISLIYYIHILPRAPLMIRWPLRLITFPMLLRQMMIWHIFFDALRRLLVPKISRENCCINVSLLSPPPVFSSIASQFLPRQVRTLISQVKYPATRVGHNNTMVLLRSLNALIGFIITFLDCLRHTTFTNSLILIF